MICAWDLVLFSDPSGRGVARRHAAHIEQDLNVEMNPYPSSVQVPNLVSETEAVVCHDPCL
jgi:hypothetical protein